MGDDEKPPGDAPTNDTPKAPPQSTPKKKDHGFFHDMMCYKCNKWRTNFHTWRKVRFHHSLTPFLPGANAPEDFDRRVESQRSRVVSLHHLLLQQLLSFVRLRRRQTKEMVGCLERLEALERE